MKKNLIKKILAVSLSSMIILTTVPVGVKAAETQTAETQLSASDNSQSEETGVSESNNSGNGQEAAQTESNGTVETKTTDETKDKSETNSTDTSKKNSRALLQTDITLSDVSYNITYGEQTEKNLVIENKSTSDDAKITKISLSNDNFVLLKKENGVYKEVTGSSLSVNIAKSTSNKDFYVRPKERLAYSSSDYTTEIKVTFEDSSDSSKSYSITANAKIKVAQKNLALTLTAADRVYDGTTVVQVSVADTKNALVSGDTLTTPITGTLKDANAGDKKEVTVNASQIIIKNSSADAKGNYNVTFNTPTVNITKKTVTPSVDSVSASKTYDGKKTITGTLTLDGVLSADQKKVTASGTFNLDSADAGTYKKVTVNEIELTGDMAGNYVLSDTSLTYKTTVTVKKAAANKTPKKIRVSSYTYNKIKIKARSGEEYSIDNGETWKSTNGTYVTFKSLKASEKYTILVRRAATTNYKASVKADYKSTEVTTLRSPVVADSAKNSVSGITNSGTYKVSNKITFTATGASTGMSSDSLDDVKYVPKNWSSTTGSSGTWTATPYTANFTPTKSGSYTLSVTYQKLKYDGTNWVDQGEDYVKKISFTINTTGRSTTTTSTTKSTSSTSKTTTAAKTDDTTPFLPMILLAGVCLAIIAAGGVIGAKKRRNK